MSGTVPGSQAAELHRDVFTVLAHELGGIASSLALRADALAVVLPSADHAALCALAEEVRNINRVLRLIRGPQGSEALAPARNMPVAQWWRFVSRLTNAILPRGAVVHATLEAAPLTPLQASTLSHLWLAACKELSRRGVQPPCRISLTVTPRDEPGEGVTLLAELPADSWPAQSASRSASRWFRYSARLARLNGAELQWWAVERDAARWLCSMGVL